MADLPELPLNGYYRSTTSTYVDSYLFLRLYADGYWLFQDTNDDGYDFPAYESALDVDAIRRQYPQGHCRRDAAGGFRYRVGRYSRQADAPVNYEVVGGRDIEVGRLVDALVLTSWNEREGERRFMEVEVIGPGLLKPTAYDVVCEFVPDNPDEQV